eukprot:1626066-Heterocapsa_arctica.AAC.1
MTSFSPTRGRLAKGATLLERWPSADDLAAPASPAGSSSSISSSSFSVTSAWANVEMRTVTSDS